jgi:hypothetical protein
MAPVTRSKAVRQPPHPFSLSTVNLPQSPAETYHSTELRATTSRAPRRDDPTNGGIPDFPHNNQTNRPISIDSNSSENVPVIYTIDLSLPPAQRYVKVAQDFRLVIEDLTNLFDELLDEANLPKKTFHFIAKCVLRKLYSKEQTEELRGIRDVTGVPMYLLVAYNVLLDFFMGCTSGGVIVKERREKQGRMCHFRTLDWGMPALRKALVQFEFRNGAKGEVMARSINYVGFVGTLTGVRKGLSVSLNFRPYHNDNGSKRANMKFYSHLLAVLLGWRPSICAHLRDIIIPSDQELRRRKREMKKGKAPSSSEMREEYMYSHHSLADIAKHFPSTPTTAAYLTFCDGSQTLILEKDRITAKPLLSSSFITVTNHDTSYEPSSSLSSNAPASAAHVADAKSHQLNTGMDLLVEESMDRKDCMTYAWAARLRQLKLKEGEGERGYVGLEQLKEWLLEHPVLDEQTHFVAIMDPGEGSFKWVRMWEEGEIVGESWSEDRSADGE